MAGEFVPGLSPLMTVMQSAARKASRSLLRDFGEVEHLQVARKGPADFVSRADKKAEEVIFENLRRDRPGYGFLMEESGEISGTDKTHRFIVDPLDGTTNFLHGIAHFSVSIALEREGEIVAGLVYNPINDEMFFAETGKGATGALAVRIDVCAQVSAIYSLKAFLRRVFHFWAKQGTGNF